ncbi:MAG: sugar transporter ATP-binding protein [Microbacteriaceae bacterium]|jgi:ribose transport system ATP-binding protein|nr:sugar transporter ATP-binding protein [Microbacteriaceae bacterium]
MTLPLLTATDVAKSYGPVVALRSANLIVEPGQAHALLGANGAGKSTFVKILTGVIGAGHGAVLMNGEEVRFSSPEQARRGGIASVYQDPALLPDLTLRQNLKLTRTPLDEVEKALEQMGLAGLDLNELVRDVSLPFLRMIDLARALAHRPRLLVLDEITAALPTDLAATVFEVMRRQTDSGGSVLFISHRLEEVVTYCDMCTVFRDGKDVAAFVPREGGENRIVQAMLGDAANLVREGGRRSVQDLTAVAPRLRVEHVAAGRELVDVSFDVRPGEVVGVVALEGQGQDILFEALAGDRRFSSGEVLVDGERLVARHPAAAIDRGMVLVPADRATALLPQRSIEENLALTLYRRGRSWGPIPGRAVRTKVQNAIDRMSIDTRAAAQARRLSGGNQQKLTIGRWLTAGFKTLLLFDPTRGIDIGTKHQIYDLIREEADNGAAVLMYTSELREIALVADRVVVLYRGRIVAELPAAADEEELLSAAHGMVPNPADLEVGR